METTLEIEIAQMTQEQTEFYICSLVSVYFEPNSRNWHDYQAAKSLLPEGMDSWHYGIALRTICEWLGL